MVGDQSETGQDNRVFTHGGRARGGPERTMAESGGSGGFDV